MMTCESKNVYFAIFTFVNITDATVTNAIFISARTAMMNAKTREPHVGTPPLLLMDSIAAPPRKHFSITGRCNPSSCVLFSVKWYCPVSMLHG